MKKSVQQTTFQPITVTFSWEVKSGKEEEFTNWLHGIARAATRWPGHLGVTNLRPPKGQDTYQSVLRFDTDEHLKAWLDSSERHEWIDQLKGIAVVHSNKATGLESWFDLPGQSVAPPPKWKMVAVTFIAVYPLSLLLGAFVSPHITKWNIFIRSFLFPLIVPVVLTYSFMPFLTQHVFKRWLYKLRS
ncbi:MAG: antibiotic biosynthesis monooxygenase [Candidatus Saccharibacteria bacterium]|nr:antibiotic biosynthesis monooxygenase [Candidatus Saccharibacteria bacterium]